MLLVYFTLLHVSTSSLRLSYISLNQFCPAQVINFLLYLTNSSVQKRVDACTCLNDCVFKIRTVATYRHFCRRLTELCRRICCRRTEISVYRVNRGCPCGHMLGNHWSKNALLRNLPGESKRAYRPLPKCFSRC